MTPALPSIRSRLTRLLVGVALVWGLLVSLAVWLTVRQEVDELLDETLQASAEVLGRLLSAGDADSLARAGAALEHEARNHEHFAWQLVGAGGAVLLRSSRAPQQAWLPLPTPGFVDAPSGWRVYGLRLAGGERMLYVAQSSGERREAETEVALTAMWSALAIGVLSALWLRGRVRRELAPLADLSQALARYEPLPPSVPLAAAERRELLPVHAAIAALGERLARRVANERAFSAHAAHALRTPLAGIDTQLAVAQREAPDALQPRLARVREAAGRLTRVVSALLALFRSGAELQWQTLELPALLARLPHEGLELRVTGGATVQADADLLTATLINLLDNAVRHGARRVDLNLAADDGRQLLCLHDDGQGCPARKRAELTQALDSQAYEGRMGLGLMLADLVARAHGGRLRLPAVEHGFAVELELGRADRPAPALA
jgi:signal transduction histidine kinase